MKYIVGLGNIGKEYEFTRHNAGFIVVNALAAKRNLTWDIESKLGCEVAKDKEFVFLKPQDFMNNSGEALQKYVSFYKIEPADIVVINDDIDLVFGRIKEQVGATSAGHKGVEDIIEKLGTKDFKRIRIGVGKPDNKNIEISDWVLSPFSSDELAVFPSITTQIEKTLSVI